MEQYDLSEGKRHEQELSEETLSNVIGAVNLSGVRNLITKQQFGKPFAAVIGAGLIEGLVPNPGEKPIWKH
jgi:hypothetical protein